jgi:hypothetical protein
VRQLIIRPGAIGDTILSLPALEHLSRRYTEIWVRSDVAPLVRFAGCVRPIASTGLDLLGIEDITPPVGLFRRLASFDSIWSWYGSNRPEFRAALGSVSPNPRFLPALPPDGAGMHAADFFLEQVGGTGPAIPRIDTGVARGRGFVSFHPFSGSERKNWPLSRFVDLEELLRREGVAVEWAARSDCTRFDDLFELAKWLRNSAVYVGNDSGITHLAAAAGVPVVALFGPTDPAVWGPRADPLRVIRAQSMDAIDVRCVRDAVLELLR